MYRSAGAGGARAGGGGGLAAVSGLHLRQRGPRHLDQAGRGQCLCYLLCLSSLREGWVVVSVCVFPAVSVCVRGGWWSVPVCCLLCLST